MGTTQVALDLVTVVGPIALAALGFATIYRISGHMHFAYGGIWTMGTYIFGWALANGWNMVAAFVLMLAVSCVLAVASYGLYIRLTGQYAVVLTSFAIFTILVGLTQLIFGAGSYGFDADRALSGVWTLGNGAYVSQVAVVQLAIALLAGLALAYVLGRTGIGLAARAVSENPGLAEVTGIKTKLVTIAAYLLGTTLGAASAALHVVGLGSSLDSGEVLTLEILAVTILAGRVIVATLPTAIFFGAILVAAEQVAGPAFVTMIGYAVLFIVLRLRPEGLFRRDLTIPESRPAAATTPAAPVADVASSTATDSTDATDNKEAGTRV